MRGCIAAVTFIALVPAYVGAEEAGRALNWETMGAPNYQRPTLGESSKKDTYELPALPQEDQQPDATATLSQAPSVYVHEIRITGATVFTPDELAEMTKPYLDRSITTEDLQALRLALSRKYLERGFINSGVAIPDQQVEDGVIELRAIEGNLTKIEVDGKPHLSDGYLTSRIRRYVNEPLNIQDVQYALQWLQMDSRITRLDGRLVPGDELGQSVLHLAVDEPKRFDIGMSADNHRATSVGSEVARIALTARNLSGYGEETSVIYGMSEGANDGSASFAIPVTRWNTSVQAYFLREDDEIVQQRFRDLDIKSVTDTWGVAVIQPIIEGLSNTVSMTVGFESKDSKSELAGVPYSFSPGAQDGKSETSVAQLGLDWTNRGPNSVLALRATYRRGLDVLGATIFDPQSDYDRLLDPTGADGKFGLEFLQGLFLYRMNQLPGLSRMNDRAQVVFRTSAQLSQDPLMSLEKMAIGGANTVRGYPENFLVRDNGVAATFEFQVPIPGYHPEPHPLNLLIAPFVDYGRSWDEVDTDQASATVNTNDARYIVSVGVGLIWQPLNGLQAQISWGDKLDDNFQGDEPPSDSSSNSLQDKGVYFSMSYVASF